jgi:hypothetical protein
LHGFVIGGDAVDRQIAAGQVLSNSVLFRFDNGAQQRNFPFFVAVDAYAQVDLGR